MKKVNRQWRLKTAPHPQKIRNLQQAINASQMLATLLLQRGIEDFEAARLFFNPAMERLHDPFLMKDMGKAVERITAATKQEENILVYGDYDVDGTTAVALVYTFLTQHTHRTSYYIPHRYKEGYGVSLAAIDFAADNEISLIIALDCGIKAVEQIEYANEKGIDFIICDHHLPSDDVPAAHAILNPLQKDCNYPYKYLSGCGIGYKLTQALTSTWQLDKSTPNAQLDLVAIAAACDIVPMTGENRILAHFGLELMQDTQRPGIAHLLENAGRLKNGRLKNPLTVSDLVFAIGPRINAAGRMDHGLKAVELLCAKTSKAAEKAALSIVKSNQERREVDAQMLDQALAMLDTSGSKTTNVLFDASWHKGVVGIVASRVQDFLYRPTIILTEANGLITGSARSVEGYDVHAAIAKCSDLLESFGGHKAAAGLTLKLEKLEEFKTKFEQCVSKSIKPNQLTPIIEADLQLQLADITPRFFETMCRMAPFGPQNRRPVFVTHNLINAEESRAVGAEKDHLKLDVKQKGDAKSRFKGIAFGLGALEDRIATGEIFSAIYTLDLNEYNGLKSIEMVVKDIRFTDL